MCVCVGLIFGWGEKQLSGSRGLLSFLTSLPIHQPQYHLRRRAYILIYLYRRCRHTRAHTRIHAFEEFYSTNPEALFEKFLDRCLRHTQWEPPGRCCLRAQADFHLMLGLLQYRFPPLYRNSAASHLGPLYCDKRRPKLKLFGCGEACC